MPESITKNRIDDEPIANITRNGLRKEAIDIHELTEGYFNTAYNIKTEDGMEYILKVAPSDNVDIMGYEKNIMFSEVDSMRLVSAMTNVPVPHVCYYDDRRTLLPVSYFFMDKLPGASLSTVMDKWKLEDDVDNSGTDKHIDAKDRIYYKLGQYNKELNLLGNDFFGYYGLPESQGKNWYDVFKNMMQMLLDDGARKNVDFKTPPTRILELLEQDRHYFEEVTKPCFVHWDIWAGNVFVAVTPESTDGSEQLYISGIIDFERCLWGDPLLEVNFRTYNYNKSFFDGYGIDHLSENEVVRAKWYDIYMFLQSSLEDAFRHYGNDHFYKWGTEMLSKWIESKGKSW